MTAVDALRRGREAYEERSWGAAHESLSAADATTPLGARDLELLATSAYMLGHEEEYRRALARAYQAHLDAGDSGCAAAQCAIWLGLQLFTAGAIGQASGWLARARRLVERDGGDCVEQGYLLMPTVFEHMARGDVDAALATAAEAAEIGERFGDADLSALARMDQGVFLVSRGDVLEGLRLLDEAMVAVTTGELSPIPSGLVYCGVIIGCQGAYQVRRAQEWTAALTEWCSTQPDMVAFTGRCLLHRAEIMELQGAWGDALAEARRAAERALRGKNERAAAEAIYRQAEIHRLRGRVRLRRGGLPRGWPARAGAATRAGPAAAGAAARWSGGGRDPAGARRRPASNRSERACSPPPSRSCWRSARAARPVGPATSSTPSRTASTATCCARWPPMRREPSTWARATRQARSPGSAGRGRSGTTSTRPTRRRGSASSSASPAARWEMTTGRRWRLDAARAILVGLGAEPDWPASTRSALRLRPARRTG